MPSEKPRSKEDTWRPEELEKSLKEMRSERRSDRSRDDGSDRDRRRRHTDDSKERRSKDKPRRSDGDKRTDQSIEKESDRLKREEGRIKDEEREERHRRKKEERRERDHNMNGDENNHNDRDRDRRRDGSERRKKRETDGIEIEDRHKDDRKRRSHREDDDRRSHNDDDRRRRHKNDDEKRHSSKADDDDKRHSRKNEEERRRSHRDEDRRRSHKDGDDDGSKRRSDREKDRRRSQKDDDDDGDDGGGSRRRSDREKERRSHNEEEKRRSHKDDDRAHRRRSHKDEDGGSRRRSHKNDEERRSHKSDDRRHSRRDDDEDYRGGSHEEGGSHQNDDRRRSHREDNTEHTEHKRNRERKHHRNDSNEREKYKDSDDQEQDKKIEKADPEDNDGDNYEDDFEDYEEDFEDDAEESDAQSDKPQTEVDAVLKALDAENNRLMAESRRSYGSDSTELSDERFRSSQTPSKQRTFINFVSAKQMVLSDKASNKTRTRGRDLLQLIDLDVSAYDMFDLPPVKEYDLYIRNFGRTDTAQVYVQTNEDAIDREIQTEELEFVEKWSQHPCEESAASGRGDGEREDDDDVSLRPIQTADLTKLSRFIHRAGQTVSILLEEESGGDNHQPTSQSSISVSQGFSQLANPPYLQGRCVDRLCFSPSQPHLLLTLYSPSQDKEEFSEVCSVPGVICVWNVSEPSVPQKILVCDSMPTSCCYSPTSTALVFAGMADGSLVLWDLREPSSLHTSTRMGDAEYSLRHPTYNTAGVLGEENHQSAVVMVTPTLPPATSSKSATSLLDDTGGASYQIVSVDQIGTVNLWVVAQISSPDQAGSESDLGLAPGGRVKLLRSSSFLLDNPVRDLLLRPELRVTCLQLSPGDPNQFIVGTDSGLIVHAARFGSKPFPRCYLGSTESPVDVTCIDYSPFCNPCFLAGCSDGTVRLYNTNSGKPVIVWPARDMGASVVGVQWSRSRPAVFYILYDNSTLAVYDLVETDTRPTVLDNIQTGRALGLAVSPDPYCRGQGQPDKHPHLVLTLETGKTEIHSIAKTFVEQQPFEEDFLKSYLDRF